MFSLFCFMAEFMLLLLALRCLLAGEYRRRKYRLVGPWQAVKGREARWIGVVATLPFCVGIESLAIKCALIAAGTRIPHEFALATSLVEVLALIGCGVLVNILWLVWKREESNA